MKNKSVKYYMAERSAKKIGSSLTPLKAVDILKAEYKGSFDHLLQERISEMIYELLKSCYADIDEAEIQKAAYGYFGG